MNDYLIFVPKALEVVSWIIICLGLFQNLIYLLQIPAAWREFRQYSQREDAESSWHVLLSDMAMPISLLVPAYNEETTIVGNTRSMLSLQYPNVEVTIINDGSNDNTLKCLIDAFELKPMSRSYELKVPHAPIRQLYGSALHPRLLVIDKENGKGKADAINAGINLSRFPLFCVIDADSILEPEALLRAVRPFMEDPKHMVAVGGTISVLNGCKVEAGQVVRSGLSYRILPLIQTMEYIRSFLVARLAWSRWGVLTLISGAFGIFNRQVAIEVGGFSHDTVGEDLEMILKMHEYLCKQKRHYTMRYVPEPVCWTEVPETLSVLGTQRKRWQRGALEGFFRHRNMLFNPKYGKIGMLGLPYALLVDLLGPIAEIMGYVLISTLWLLGILDFHFFLAFLSLFIVMGIFFSVCSLLLTESELRRFLSTKELFALTFAAVIENFGYRQLNSVWRMMGWWQFLHKKSGWGDMRRRGFTSS